MSPICSCYDRYIGHLEEGGADRTLGFEHSNHCQAEEGRIHCSLGGEGALADIHCIDHRSSLEGAEPILALPVVWVVLLARLETVAAAVVGSPN